ncbi:ASC protein, partial [Chunga burmeisteri]|nr:ASC protein [Chunga burmeisteri]
MGTRDRVLRALEELSAEELRRLKAALNRLPVAAGYSTIPRGRMEKADALDLTDLVIGHYQEKYGATVTAEALRHIQRRDLADGLTRDEGEAVGGGLARDVAAPSPAERFVRRHRVTLIDRVRGVSAMLDRLEVAGVLTTEMVAEVAAGPTPQEQMRRLLATAPAWGRRGHDLFLKALRDLHPYLVEELETG